MRKKGRRLLMILWILCYCFNLSGQEVITDLSDDSTIGYVQFKKSSSDLILDFKGNREVLTHLVQKIVTIAKDKGYSMFGIRITGYASPEGSKSINKRLSQERAEVLKNYLIENTQLPMENFEVIVGGENWDGLRVMVESSEMAHKAEVLEILANDQPDKDRKFLLKALPDGTYYYLLQRFFSKLRGASSIQIFKLHPKTQSAPIAEVVPATVVEVQPVVEVKDTVQEVPVSQEPLVVQQSSGCTSPTFGVSTNLVYWAAAIIPNIQLEYYFANRYSVTLEGVYRWFKDGRASHNNANMSYVSPELRFFLKEDASYLGHYFGAYGQYGEYDIKLGSLGRQGNYKGGGLSYGFVFKFNRLQHLYFDLGLSLGYGRMSYDCYRWADPCNGYTGHVDRNYWGPTKMKASLIWRF